MSSDSRPGEPVRFVQASRLYDAGTRERTHWDWRKGQPVAESQQEIEEALAAIGSLGGARRVE